MFSRVFVAVLVALPMIASATPTPNHPHGGSGQCNVGEVHCCEQTHSIGNTEASSGGLLGIPLNLVPQLGFNCNPISVIGLGGNNCAAQPVCCNQNSFNGGSLFGFNILNCSPLNVNL